MSDDVVRLEKDGAIGLLTLNRPDKRNAINEAMKAALIAGLEAAGRDRDVTVVVLRGAGRSFCAGYDISGDDAERERIRRDPVAYHQRSLDSLRLVTGIWDLPKPVIASVQGHALGEGCILSMACDLTIAAADARFGEPEIRYAAPASAVLMPWLIGVKRARELIYTGDLVDAETARELGIVNRVVPPDELAAATLRYARRLALIGPEALSRAKIAINRAMELRGIRNGLNAAVDVIAPLYTTETAAMRAFRDKVAEVGLSQALRWRGAQFEE